jgi:hypothetical protein
MVNKKVRKGTMIMPPPIPNNPAANPVKLPSTANAPTCIRVINKPFI